MARIFADDAGRDAAGVSVDLAASRVGREGGDAGSLECRGVGDDDVAVGAIEDCGVTCCDLVDVLAGGKLFRLPLGMIPAGAKNPSPWCSLRGVGGDPGLHIGERCGVIEVDREALLAGVRHVGVGVVEAGHDEGTVEVDDLGMRPFELENVCVGAYSPRCWSW